MGDEADRITEDGLLTELFGNDGYIIPENVYEGMTCPECGDGWLVEKKDEQSKYLYCDNCKVRWT
jgi:predicted RNA-binding Zn-ribbon protein involved in translation (DUF1610 family)